MRLTTAIAALLFSLAPAMATDTAGELRAQRDILFRQSLKTLGQLRTSLSNCSGIYSSLQDATAQAIVMAEKFYDMPQGEAIELIGDGEKLERAILKGECRTREDFVGKLREQSNKAHELNLQLLKLKQ